jgi:hypothetical protein
MTLGTEAVGFLKLAIFSLRAIEHPARAVALTTEMIAVQGEGERLWFAGGGLWTMKATSEETDGAFSL